MTWYEMPNATDSQGLYEFFGYVNKLSNSLFFPVMLVVVWFISFVGTFNVLGRDRPAGARAFTFASFLISVLSIMLAIMGFLASKFMYLSFILVAIGVLWLKAES